MSVHSVGHGIIGGHVYTVEAAAGKVAVVREELPTARGHKTSRSKTYRRSRCSTGASLSAGALARTACRPAARAFQRSDFLGAIQVVAIVGAFDHPSASCINCSAARRRRRRQRAKLLDQLNAELEERIAARTAALNNKSRELEPSHTPSHTISKPRCAASTVTAACSLKTTQKTSPMRPAHSFKPSIHQPRR